MGQSGTESTFQKWPSINMIIFYEDANAAQWMKTRLASRWFWTFDLNSASNSESDSKTDQKPNCEM